MSDRLVNGAVAFTPRIDAPSSSPAIKKPVKPTKPNVLFERAGNAVKALVKNGQIREIFTFEKKEWPELFKKLRPDYNNTSRLVIVNQTNDDLHFHLLESFRPFGENYVHKHPVNVDGTSASTWPDWLVITEPEAPDESNANASNVPKQR
jgi:hypothetical protein